MKWHLLERNRWAAIVRTYPTELIVALAPALVATEIAVLMVAARDGWLRDKIGAMRELAGWMPRLLRERREIQARSGRDSRARVRRPVHLGAHLAAARPRRAIARCSAWCCAVTGGWCAACSD